MDDLEMGTKIPEDELTFICKKVTSRSINNL